jgi:hypothetical protein
MENKTPIEQLRSLCGCDPINGTKPPVNMRDECDDILNFGKYFLEVMDGINEFRRKFTPEEMTKCVLKTRSKGI